MNFVMKNKKIVLILLLLAVFLLVVFLRKSEALANIFSSDEKCNIELGIREKSLPVFDSEENVIDENIEFSLVSVESVYNGYNSQQDNYESRIYTLNIYDKEGNLAGRYSLNSARIVFFDSLDSNYAGYGEEISSNIEVLDDGVIYAAIPYSQDIARVTIEYRGEETELNINFQDLKCGRDCGLENETGNYETERCCSGLTRIQQDEEHFACVNCGDSVCSEFENEDNCYVDCAQNFTCPGNMNKQKFDCVEASKLPILPKISLQINKR